MKVPSSPYVDGDNFWGHGLHYDSSPASAGDDRLVVALDTGDGRPAAVALLRSDVESLVRGDATAIGRVQAALGDLLAVGAKER